MIPDKVFHTRSFRFLLDCEFNLLTFFKIRTLEIFHMEEHIFFNRICHDEAVFPDVVKEIYFATWHTFSSHWRY